MKVYWLEQTEADLPTGGTGTLAFASTARSGCATSPDPEWLSAREKFQLGGMRFPKRRADWQLGRWTAKHAVAACLQLSADLPKLAEIEVRPDRSGAPEIFLGNHWAPVMISISHRAGRAVCAVASRPAALGCDLEVIEPRSDAFIADYLATEEQALVAQTGPADQPGLVTLLWSAKESTLKALRAGLRLDTRRVIVSAVDTAWRQNENGEAGAQEGYAQNLDFPPQQLGAFNGWRPLRVRHINDQTFLGWWQQTGNLLRTIVGAPPPARPRLLNLPLRSTSGPSEADWKQSQAA